MAYKFTVIYNPKSTGQSQEMAEAFVQELKSLRPKPSINLVATKRPKHAEKIAFDAAMKHKNSVIVSASGDGGYHEVINGALKAAAQNGVAPICAVLPAGNANDHYSSISTRPLIEALKAGDVSRLDLLAVNYGRRTRYAHSYIGLGITPLVAVELNRHTLSRLKETLLAVKALVKLRPLKIEIAGQQNKLDSLIITNIYKMAKYLTISENSDPSDGKFEVIKWPHKNKLRLFRILISSVFGNGPRAMHATHYELSVQKTTPMQMDGEIILLKKGTKVRIAIEPGALRTFR